MTVSPATVRTPPHILTLVLATSVGPLAMNVFLPSLPSMAVYFQTDYRVVQLAVSLYLVATALLQLVIGPASDRFGRRVVMLVCLGIFLVGTLAAIVAPTIELLLAARVLQAFAVAGVVLSRAIVRDMVETADAASKVGYITMGMALVPMIGPIIGGVMDELYGWHSTFILTFAFGLLAFVIVYLDLGETNHAPSSSLLAQVRSYPELFRSRRFWGYSASAGFASGAFFAFLGGGPYVSTEILRLRPSEYGLYFALLSMGYILGNFLSGRYSRRVGINMMILTGGIVSVAGMAASFLLFGIGLNHPISLFGPIALVGIGNGLTLPNATAGVVSVRPRLAGSAAGLGGALQIGGGAALAVVAGAMLTPTSGPWPLLWVMLISSILAVVSALYVIHVARKAGEI